MKEAPPTRITIEAMTGLSRTARQVASTSPKPRTDGGVCLCR